MEDKYEPETDGYGKKAPLRSRINNAKNLPPLFHDCEFYFTGDFSKGMPLVGTRTSALLARLRSCVCLSHAPPFRSGRGQLTSRVSMHQCANAPMRQCDNVTMCQWAGVLTRATRDASPPRLFRLGRAHACRRRLFGAELTQLVQAGGGKVLGREPRDPRPIMPYHSLEGHYKSTSFIVQAKAPRNFTRTNGVHEITRNFLLNCISNFAMLDPKLRA